LVDALVSGTSEVTLVEVQVLSRAPRKIDQAALGLFFLAYRERTQNLMSEQSEREVVEVGLSPELVPRKTDRKRAKPASPF
jgi:hypothetical protein